LLIDEIQKYAASLKSKQSSIHAEKVVQKLVEVVD